LFITVLARTQRFGSYFVVNLFCQSSSPGLNGRAWPFQNFGRGRPAAVAAWLPCFAFAPTHARTGELKLTACCCCLSNPPHSLTLASLFLLAPMRRVPSLSCLSRPHSTAAEAPSLKLPRPQLRLTLLYTLHPTEPPFGAR
jgi:hypothetical protein